MKADESFLAPVDGRALFASLALAVAEHPVLLIGTSRRGLPEAWIADVDRAGHFERMTLGRLGAKDIGKLILEASTSRRATTAPGRARR